MPKTICSKLLYSIIVPVFLFVVVYLIAYYLSGFDMNAHYVDDEGFWYEVSERHYWGAFTWEHTWFVWLVYIVLILLFELIIWRKK